MHSAVCCSAFCKLFCSFGQLRLGIEGFDNSFNILRRENLTFCSLGQLRLGIATFCSSVTHCVEESEHLALSENVYILQSSFTPRLMMLRNRQSWTTAFRNCFNLQLFDILH